MNQKSFLSIALALLLATSGSSFAQGNSSRERNDNDRDCRNGQRNCAGPDQRQRPNARQPNRPDARERGYQNWRAPQRNTQPRYDAQRRHDDGARREERGAGPDHAYFRGDRLPPRYRERQYVVEDWRGHRLSAPPRGYHWVQSGGDYILVAIATGIILQLLLSY